MKKRLSTLAIGSLLVMAPMVVFSEERGRDTVAESIGRELAVPVHLADDEEFHLPLPELVAYGKKLFEASWTDQEGGGRPRTKGTGRTLSDPSDPLVGARSFNRLSGPDANPCAAS